MSRIVIATEYINEHQNSTGYLWSKIIKKLSADEFDLEVVSPGIHIKYESLDGDSGILSKLKKQIKIALNLAGGIINKADDKNIVFTGTNPVVLLCIMPILRRIRSFRWILLVHDVFPENLVASGFVRKTNPLLKIGLAYFNWVYSSADSLICIGRDMQKIIENKSGNRKKTFYIPNWVDENDIYPLPRRFKNLGLDDFLVFQFFGNIGRVQGVKNLLNAIAMVKANNAAFLFMGGGAMASEVEDFIKINPAKKILYLGPVPLDKKNEGLALCDVSFVSLEAGMLGLGVPSKTYFALAAGKPILAAVEAESEIGLMLSEHSVGWRCDPNSAEQLAKLIDEICSTPQQLERLKPRQVFLENYSEKIVLNKMSNFIKEINKTSSH